MRSSVGIANSHGAKGALVPGVGATRIGCANRGANRARHLVSASDPSAWARSMANSRKLALSATLTDNAAGLAGLKQAPRYSLSGSMVTMRWTVEEPVAQH